MEVGASGRVRETEAAGALEIVSPGQRGDVGEGRRQQRPSRIQACSSVVLSLMHATQLRYVMDHWRVIPRDPDQPPPSVQLWLSAELKVLILESRRIQLSMPAIQVFFLE
ncbi:hypothetical protein DFH09DRAFT_1072407 [Mycena vulgaris]|nr:hypothetical protein DFH09DRAFT_1072407 [Mycena vulgaris]